MIVKNESKIITRCLEGAANLVDYICISDTGSTDKTPKIIRNWARKRKIPVKVWTVRRHLGEILDSLLAAINAAIGSLSHKKVVSKFNSLYEELKDWEDQQDIIKICRYPEDTLEELGAAKSKVAVLISQMDPNNPIRHPNDTTFRNFGFNRTQSFRLAQQTFPEADYAILSDADMIFQAKNFDKNSLDRAGYQLYQVSGNLKYVNTRFLAIKYDWKCVGVTHEYWDHPEGCGGTAIMEDDELCLLDVGDGGCKADKFERDIRLLTEGLETETNPGLRTRYKFYLAQSYKDSGKPKEALKWYQERIADGGWDEEVWYAHYMMGTCYMHIVSNTEREIIDNKKRGNVETVKQLELELVNAEAMDIYWMTLAYELRSFRAEPIMTLAKHYREKGKNAISYMYAKIASNDYMQRGLKDRLFVEHQMYNHLPYFEMGVTCFYLGRLREGYDACIKLLAMDNVPEDMVSRTKQNLAFYEKALNPVKEQPKVSGSESEET